jgi:hypothetical protein
LRIWCISGQSICLSPSVGSIAKEVFNADKKQMHAEHADSYGLNDLSGPMIGCAFTSACGRVSACHAWRSNTWPTACEALRAICVFCVHLRLICLEFLSCPAVPRAQAEQAGVSASYLAEIETGKKPGSADALRKLSCVLAPPMETLISQSGDQHTYKKTG